MNRILVITNNLDQASFRLRISALIEPLRERGFDLEVRVRPRGWIARRRLLRTAGDYDSVILQRKLLDPSDARLLRRAARRIIFDVDDAVMYEQDESRRLAQWRTTRRFRATAGAADRVVAGSEHLARLFATQRCLTTIIPTVVDPAAYSVKRHTATPSPSLVWIGSRSTLPYVRSHLGAIATPGVRLVVIADETLADAPIPLDFVPWSWQTEAEALLRGDIGIAPTPDDRWTRGKCGFKIVQYMAAGLPMVASPVGANSEIVVDGVTGFLVRTDGEWTEAITRLARDADLRAKMGRAGRARVEEHYSIARAADLWTTLLKD